MPETVSVLTGPDGAGRLSPDADARLLRAYSALARFAALRRQELVQEQGQGDVCAQNSQGREQREGVADDNQAS